MRGLGGNYPVIRRSNPYSSQNFRASRPVTPEAPFAGQDLGAALLQNQQFAKAAAPSPQYQDTYNYDPILQKIQALSTQSIANARTNAGALRTNAAITEGDPELLKSLGFDDNTVTAAQNNPESLLAQLHTTYAQKHKDLADAMQSQNLYYSGEYQKNLADLAKGEASAQGGLGQKLRDLLSGIDTGVLDSAEADRQRQQQAALDAAQQATYSNLYQSLLQQLMGGGSGGVNINTPGAVTTTNQHGNTVLDPAANAMPGDTLFEGGASHFLPLPTVPPPPSLAPADDPNLLLALAGKATPKVRLL